MVEKQTPAKAPGLLQYPVGDTPNNTLISIKDALRNYNEKHGATVFLQNNRLVRVTPDEKKGINATVITDAIAKLILTDTGRWTIQTPNGESKTIGYPPRDVVKDILSYGYTELGDTVPALKGLHDGVLLDSNWQLVSRKGYNPETQLYLKRDYDTYPIPETVTEEDIKIVKDMFWQIFHEFCFEDEGQEGSVDYQNTLLAFVTLVIRPMWVGALPIWTVSKSAMQCGGTLIQQVVGCLALGIDPPRVIFSEKGKTEIENTINTVIMSRQRYCILDNVPSGYNWVTTNLLTQSTGNGITTIRKLGTNESITTEACTSFAVNGINLEIRADICRRINPVRLVLTNRWQDTTHHTVTEDQLIQNAINMHPLAVWGVAVIHKYWIQQGKPAPHECTGNVAAYKKWYYEVCGMLESVGYTHLLDNLRDLQTADNDEDAETAGFLNALGKVYGKEHFTPSDLTKYIIDEAQNRRASSSPGLFLPYLDDKRVEAATRGTLSDRSIGWYLKQYRNTVVTGSMYKLVFERTMVGRYYRLADVAEKNEP